MFTVYVGLFTTHGEYKTIEEAIDMARWLKEKCHLPVAEVREK